MSSEKQKLNESESTEPNGGSSLDNMPPKNVADAYRSLSGIGYVTLDEELKVTSWNAYMVERFGIQEIDAIGHTFHNLLPAGIGGFRELHKFHQALKSSSPEKLESSHQRADGTIFTLDIELQPIINIIGKSRSAGCLLAIRDITHSKRVESQLKQSLQIGKIGTFFQQLEPRTVFEGDIALDLLGVTVKSSFFIENLPLLVDPQSQKYVEEKLVTLFSKDTIIDFDFRLNLKDKERWLHCRCQSESDGKNRRVSGAFQDITDRIISAQKSQEKEFQTRRFIRSVPAVVVQIRRSSGGMISFPYVSRKAQDILGVSPDAAMNGPIIFSMLPAPSLTLLADSLKESNENSTRLDTEFVFNHPTKGVRYIKILAEPAPGNDECLWDGLIFDNSEQRERDEALKRSQEQVEEAAKLSMMGAALAGIAHDMATPLSLIIGNLELMMRKLKHDEAANADLIKLLNRIEKGSNHLTGLVHSLKRVSRNSKSDEFLQVDLKSVAQDAFTIASQNAKKAQVEVTVDVPDDLITYGHPSELTQVLINLIGNAVDAVENNAEKWIKVSGGRTGTSVWLDVTDSGKGIPPEVVDKIMEAFYTTKPVGKGTGLGLSICQKIAKDHHGEITVDKHAPHTRFVVMLPDLNRAKDLKKATSEQAA